MPSRFAGTLSEVSNEYGPMNPVWLRIYSGDPDQKKSLLPLSVFSGSYKQLGNKERKKNFKCKILTLKEALRTDNETICENV
jgi:hypothetical protein